MFLGSKYLRKPGVWKPRVVGSSTVLGPENEFVGVPIFSSSSLKFGVGNFSLSSKEKISGVAHLSRYFPRFFLFQENVMRILGTPPKATPPSNKGLIRPYFLGGVALGGVARIPMKMVGNGSNFHFDLWSCHLAWGRRWPHRGKWNQLSTTTGFAFFSIHKKGGCCFLPNQEFIGWDICWSTWEHVGKSQMFNCFILDVAPSQ